MTVAGYFDYNATTPLHPAARAAWLEAEDKFWQNPSGLFHGAGAAKRRLEDCREELADFLDCGAEEIVFLSGATEANNALVAHAAAAGVERLALSGLEHPCLQEPAAAIFKDRLCTILVAADGRVDLGSLEEALRGENKPALVALMAANNETGVLQPWREARELCRKYGALFHCDAAQWLGKEPALGLGDCDFLTGSAHKFGGPKGVGFLKLPAMGRPLRWLRGGPQEEQRRAGTENVAGVAAMLAALKSCEAWLKSGIDDPAAASGMAGALSARRAFESEIQARVPGVGIVAADSPRLWNSVLLTVPPSGPANVKWLTRLSAKGFAVSTGSACSRGAGASEVLEAMGLGTTHAGRVLRVSGGWETTEQDWRGLAEAIADVAADFKNPAPCPAGRGFPT
ncbi:MAG: cysteine desulfurase [Verrucomicrobiales bacterium]|nr:cysteine desulfurase [Verrucomicrobiales bacterium]